MCVSIRRRKLYSLSKLTFDNKHRTKRTRRSQLVRSHAAGLRLRKCFKRIDWRNQREKIEHSRIRHQELLLRDSIEPEGLQCDVFRNTVVEKAYTATKNRSRRATARTSWR